ncbi:MAG: EAL domain-containing protein [Leptospirales bacterium]
MNVMYMREGNSPLTIEQAIDKYTTGRFSESTRKILSFGFGSKPVWIHLSISNSTGKSSIRQLRIENSWLDHLHVYFVKDHRVVSTYNVGNTLPFRDRPLPDRFFTFNHEFVPGITDVFMRAESIAPIVLPISLLSPQEVTQREKTEQYTYGFMYGYLLSLMAYNFLLFLGLRSKIYLLYSIFIAMFILTNIAYTGHGFAWIWPNHVTFQRWIFPIGMIAYGISGFMFARRFLNTRFNFPLADKIISWISRLAALILLSSMFGENLRFAFIDAFIFVPVFSFSMIIIGTMSLHSGYLYARYFLTASIASMIGASISDISAFLTYIPFNDWTYRAVDIGMVADATLLALALTYQFRSTQQELTLTEKLAAQDPLTGLFNRRVFKDRIEQALLRSGRSQERIAVGILDLDGFKGVNDRLGHPKGDELLILVARRLEGVLRKTDTLARLGGDEFGLLLMNLNEDGSTQDLFNKIVNSLLDPFDVGGGFGEQVRISGSLGLTLSPPDSGDVDSLIAHADLALYRAKDRGRNGWSVFEIEMAESLLEQHRIRTEFDQALRNGELCLYYQPQVNMETGQIVGAEALVRWNHPKRGFLTPSDFISVIEKCDLIFPLGRWALETALFQQKEWAREGLLLCISVNIGARHFLSDGFIKILTEILTYHGRSEYDGIKLEVTETEALQDLEKARQVIEICGDLGIAVSLDDFGTGHASLASLQQLDVKEVKIDTGFVHRMVESPKDLAIVSSLSMASHMMLIEVVAEGVETEEEGELLIQMGCRMAQGYAIAPPMLPAILPVWCREWKPFESWKKQSAIKMGSRKDPDLLMVGQAMKICMKGILAGLETPAITRAEWTDPRKCILEQWIDHNGRIRYGGTPEFESLERIRDTLFTLIEESLSARNRQDTKALERLKSRLIGTGCEIQEALQKLRSYTLD